MACACALVTRLHGVKRLRGLLPWPSTRLWYPGLAAAGGAASDAAGAFSFWATRGFCGLPGGGLDLDDPPPQAARGTVASSNAISQSERIPILIEDQRAGAPTTRAAGIAGATLRSCRRMPGQAL